MTDAEKKMKKYIRSVERRLNLPKDVKTRVMSDFLGSVQARREVGITDEEIYTELGTPQKAAADINEQMKEYAYRKSPWRFLFAACAVYGSMEVLPGLYVNLVYLAATAYMRVRSIFTPQEAYSVGIIGGADGPTAIFVTAPAWAHYVIPTAMLIVGILGYLRLGKCRQK